MEPLSYKTRPDKINDEQLERIAVRIAQEIYRKDQKFGGVCFVFGGIFVTILMVISSFITK